MSVGSHGRRRTGEREDAMKAHRHHAHLAAQVARRGEAYESSERENEVRTRGYQSSSNGQVRFISTMFVLGRTGEGKRREGYQYTDEKAVH